jgi:Cu-Zn family superoxide dismutase
MGLSIPPENVSATPLTVGKESAMTMTRIAVPILSVAAALVLSSPAFGDRDHVKRAKATINSCTDGSFVGSLLLLERPSSEDVKVVDVFLTAKGLTPGEHAVHIHEFGSCTPCSAAGSHLDLGPSANNTPVMDNHPYHSGDLVNINIGPRGNGLLITTTNRIALSPDAPDRPANRPLSIFDPNGASVVIHAMPDAYCPNPSDLNCAGGPRAACGVIQPEN